METYKHRNSQRKRSRPWNLCLCSMDSSKCMCRRTFLHTHVFSSDIWELENPTIGHETAPNTYTLVHVLQPLAKCLFQKHRHENNHIQKQHILTKTQAWKRKRTGLWPLASGAPRNSNQVPFSEPHRLGFNARKVTLQYITCLYLYKCYNRLRHYTTQSKS